MNIQIHWKHMAGPGIKPGTPATLGRSSTTEQPRQISTADTVYYQITYC